MLDGHVLVLNRVFQAVQITSARRALTLLYKGQVKAVDSEYRTYDFENWADIPVPGDDERFVRTPSRNILIPHVVQLLVFDRLPRQEVKFSRGNIYLRDGNRCQYCGKKFSSSELSLDHVVPISRGGKSTWENVVCACLPCNVKKGNKLLTETGLQLKRQPVRPKWHPLHRLEELPRRGVLERRTEGVVGPQITPRSIARRTARVRSRTPNFASRFEMWFFTVPSVMLSNSPISLLL